MALRDRFDSSFTDSVLTRAFAGISRNRQEIQLGNEETYGDAATGDHITSSDEEVFFDNKPKTKRKKTNTTRVKSKRGATRVKKPKSNSTASQDDIVRISDSLTSLENAFNKIYAYSINVRNLQQYQEKRLLSIKRESGLESKAGGGAASSSLPIESTSDSGTTAAKFDELADKIQDLSDKFKANGGSAVNGSNLLGTGAGIAAGFSKVGRKLLGPLGIVIDGYLRYQEGQSTGQIASGIGGGLLGSFAGGQLGGAVGSIFGPGGRAVGSVIGSIGGYFGGSMAGDKAYEAIQRRAGGGPVRAGGTYVVGERGPEVITFNGISGRVTPNGQRKSESTAEKQLITAVEQSARARAKLERERPPSDTSYPAKFSSYLSSLFTSIPQWMENVKKFFSFSSSPDPSLTGGNDLATVDAILAMQAGEESGGGQFLRTDMENASTMGGVYGMGDAARQDAFRRMTREQRAEFTRVTGFDHAPTLNELVTQGGKRNSRFVSERARLADQMLARVLTELTISDLRRSIGREPTLADVRGSWHMGPAGYPAFLQALARNPNMRIGDFWNAHPEWVHPDPRNWGANGDNTTLQAVYNSFLEKASRYSTGTPSGTVALTGDAARTLRVTSQTGLRNVPGGSRNHGGFDLVPANPTGGQTLVASATAGQVDFAGEQGGYGNVVIIRGDDGRSYVYGHLAGRPTVSGRVTAGTILGVMGSTGRSTGPHLHFEIRDSRGTAIRDNAMLSRFISEHPWILGGSQNSGLAPVVPVAAPATPVPPAPQTLNGALLLAGYKQGVDPFTGRSGIYTPSNNFIPNTAQSAANVPNYMMYSAQGRAEIEAYFRLRGR